MSGSRARTSPLRRTVAVASTAVALLALTAQPALAAGGFARVERAFSLSGERDHVRFDTRVVDPSPDSGLQLSSTIGSGDVEASVMVMFEQGVGTGAATRELAFEG